MSEFDVKALEAILGVSFSNSALLKQACTHRSLSKDNNERLEFLGDAILGSVIAEKLYAQYLEASEGDLTHMRSCLVRGEMLLIIAKEQGIASFLCCAPGDCEKQGPTADMIEAIIAAVYLDQGAKAAETVIDRLFATHLAEVTTKTPLKDAKTELQEWAQARNYTLPVYTITASGPPHQRVFKAQCDLHDLPAMTGPEASTRRAAEKAVAQLLLDRIENDR